MKKSVLVLLAIISLQTGCYAAFFTPDNTFEGQGYVGTLPDLTSKFKPSEPVSSKVPVEQTKKFNSANEIKPAPTDNPAFVNIILKQNKISPYITDLVDFVDMLERIYDSIENGENTQRFAARVYYFNQHADYFREKYANQPESNYRSYEKLLALSLQAKTVSQLRIEAEKYSPYLAYSGTGRIYNSANIDEQVELLKAEIERTIVILKDVN